VGWSLVCGGLAPFASSDCSISGSDLFQTVKLAAFFNRDKGNGISEGIGNCKHMQTLNCSFSSIFIEFFVYFGLFKKTNYII